MRLMEFLVLTSLESKNSKLICVAIFRRSGFHLKAPEVWRNSASEQSSRTLASSSSVRGSIHLARRRASGSIFGPISCRLLAHFLPASERLTFVPMLLTTFLLQRSLTLSICSGHNSCRNTFPTAREKILGYFKTSSISRTVSAICKSVNFPGSSE